MRIQEIADRLDAVELAGPVAAVLHPVVARVADEEPLLVRQVVIDPVVHRVEVVAARVGADVVVAALRVSRLVGHGVEAHVVAPDRADSVGWDDVAGERLAFDAAVGAADARQRVVDGDALREQRREVAVTLRGGRHGELAWLGEGVVEPLEGREEERLVAAVVELGEDHGPADGEADSACSRCRPWGGLLVRGRSRSPTAPRRGSGSSRRRGAGWCRS